MTWITEELNEQSLQSVGEAGNQGHFKMIKLQPHGLFQVSVSKSATQKFAFLFFSFLFSSSLPPFLLFPSCLHSSLPFSFLLVLIFQDWVPISRTHNSPTSALRVYYSTLSYLLHFFLKLYILQPHKTLLNP